MPIPTDGLHIVGKAVNRKIVSEEILALLIAASKQGIEIGLFVDADSILCGGAADGGVVIVGRGQAMSEIVGVRACGSITPMHLAREPRSLEMDGSIADARISHKGQRRCRRLGIDGDGFRSGGRAGRI